MSSGRICFGSGGRDFFAMAAPRGEPILAGDEFDAALEPRRCFAVARVLRALQLHAEPREQRPAPALARCNVDGGGDALWRDASRAQLHAVCNQPRKWIIAARAGGSSLEVVRVGELLGPRVRAQRLETGARL